MKREGHSRKNRVVAAAVMPLMFKERRTTRVSWRRKMFCEYLLADCCQAESPAVSSWWFQRTVLTHAITLPVSSAAYACASLQTPTIQLETSRNTAIDEPPIQQDLKRPQQERKVSRGIQTQPLCCPIVIAPFAAI